MNLILSTYAIIDRIQNKQRSKDLTSQTVKFAYIYQCVYRSNRKVNQKIEAVTTSVRVEFIRNCQLRALP